MQLPRQAGRQAGRLACPKLDSSGVKVSLTPGRRRKRVREEQARSKLASVRVCIRVRASSLYCIATPDWRMNGKARSELRMLLLTLELPPLPSHGRCRAQDSYRIGSEDLNILRSSDVTEDQKIGDSNGGSTFDRLPTLAGLREKLC